MEHKEIPVPSFLVNTDQKQDIVEKNNSSIDSAQEANSYKENSLKNIKTPSIPVYEKSSWSSSIGGACLSNNYEDISKKLNAPLETDPEFYDKIDNDNYYAHLRDATIGYGEQFDYYNNVLNKITDKLVALSNKVDGHGDSTNKGFSPTRKLNETETIIAFTTKFVGNKRVICYNSGFYIVLQALTLEEIDELIDKIDNEKSEYGKLIGGNFYFYKDFFIKKIICDAIYSHVLDSNLKNWRDKDTFYKAFSIHDYDSILTSWLAIMHPTGIGISFTCVGEDNKKCDYYDRLNVDPKQLRLHNTTLLSKEAKELIFNDKYKTLDDIITYKDILNRCEQFTNVLDYDGTKFYLKNCSLYDFFDHGGRFIAELIQDNELSADIVEKRILVREFKVFAPWIAKIDSTDGNGNPITLTTPTAIEKALAVFQTYNLHTNFREKMQDYIEKSRITNICYYMPECPKCHRKTPNDGFIPMEVQTSFFIYLWMKRSGIL